VDLQVKRKIGSKVAEIIEELYCFGFLLVSVVQEGLRLSLLFWSVNLGDLATTNVPE
jgi:hypothetical protein